MRRFVALLALSSVVPALAQEAPQPKSVILLIGDGMGASQVTLGRLAAKQLGQPYHFDRFAVTGLSATRSANSVVTDSAAGATALSTGVRTNNWTVGMDAEGAPRETLLEVAHRQGYRTGVVTNTRVTHATPAAFVAHAPHRNQEGKISTQEVNGMVRAGFPQVLIGGGLKHFNDKERAALSEAGYAVVTDPAQLEAAEGPKLAAFLGKSHLPYRIDRPEGTPPLARLTQKAVETLAAGGEPFALVVEGGRIDHAGHAHDAASMVHEQLDFDAAVGWVLDYATAHPEVLVVVTADHATGAMGISETTDLEGLLSVKASSDALLAGTKPLSAALKRALPQLDRSDAAGRASLFRELHEAGLLVELERNLVSSCGVTLSDDEVLEVFGDSSPYWQGMALGHVLSHRRGIYFYDPHEQETRLTGTHGHDGGAVPVFAHGPGAQAFGGLYDNREIPLKICALLGLPAPGATLEVGVLPAAGQKK